ncbi:hypothetical protein ETD86_38400 [Nonomuraea turkmeniaca]|uniref:Uncharacterized protein n=2 Tax=Nonomuraea turkmeniaca TaxID=103838 RepID=A0A5S4F3M3_9ACTN|nr:hypothetical protein [Nonomuraea turkmeniaca]TMR10743.1 hypothetical protein ETD86_38400 [Nonomuraea turkmeniaca]
MGGLRCVDGSFLSVTPVACTDSVGTPYEVTLELHRDGTPYGSVGERCGWLLARLARGVDEARRGRGEARRWADPDDRFPDEEPDGELFSFRYRSRTGLVGGGELSCRLRTIALWVPGQGRRGEWRLTRRAYVEAWGSTGVGMRAVLTSAQLAAFVRGLVEEAEGCLEGRDLVRNPVQGPGTGESR